MLTDMIQPLILGILVMTAVLIGLRQILASAAPQIKRSVVVFAAACGLLTTFRLRDNPAVLAEYSAQIVIAGLAVVLGLLALARRAL